MSITEKEDALFAQWRTHRPRLVADGVVSEADYLRAMPRICVVLKEVNDPDGGAWDLRRYLAEEGGRAATWSNVARWVHAIRLLQQGEEWSWAQYEQVDADFRRAQLQSICAFNLKKSPGMHTCDAGQLAQEAQLDRHFIQAQYALYDPDITLCCGTGDLFMEVAGLPPQPWQRTRRGIWWLATAPGKYVLHHPHPAARVGAHLLLYGLVDALREIRASAAAGAGAGCVPPIDIKEAAEKAT